MIQGFENCFFVNQLYDRYQKTTVHSLKKTQETIDKPIEEDGTVQDDYRIDYLKQHIEQFRKLSKME
ncbi:family 1 glycosylhydrolase (plasmid) [Klebsiella pneumoniae]|nr:family 1 glycosylhydrolase [Klebsiella pneumoniae]